MSGVAQLDLAEAAFITKDFARAVELARAALASGLDENEPTSERGEYWPRPQTSRCEVVLGMALLELGQQGDALPHLDRAVELDRDEKRAWANRGHLRHARGEAELAIADLTHALKRDPSYAFARLRRAQAQLDLNRVAEAEADLAEILMRNPFDEAPLALWTDLRTQQGLPSEISALPALLDPYWLLARASIFMQHGDPGRALADYDASFAIRPDAYVRAHRATAYRQLGNLEAARADLEAYIATSPPSIDVWRQLLAQIDEPRN
jgi:tetratricopeptide (TPR) repeat protein